MGLFADAVRSIVPTESKVQAVGSMVPTWQVGVPQYPQNSHAYERLARQGYMADEIVYSCIESIARTASMPTFAVFRQGGKLAEQVDTHPALELLAHPNKFLSSFGLWANTVTHLHVAGNAYWEKVRSPAGKVVEYWLLRPDRMRIIPDAKKFIQGYEYRLGNMSYRMAPNDVIHFKTRHILDDYYGLSPLAILTGRTDLSVWSREFALSFFRNSGVPSGLLNIMRSVNEQERALIRQRFRQEYGGPQGWHNMLVLDNGEATYTQMGLPLDKLMANDLDESNEARICSVLAVPPSVVGTRIGQHSSSYANRKSDIENWWESTLIPMYADLCAQLLLGTTDDFPDVDHYEADTSNVPALAQDEDATHNRVRADFTAGLITRGEARLILDYPEEPDVPGVYLVAATMIETPSDRSLDDIAEALEPDPPPPAPVIMAGAPGAPALPAGGAKPAAAGDASPKPPSDKAPADKSPTDKAPATPKGKMLEQKKGGPFDYQSTQCNLSPELTAIIANWVRDNVDTDDLGPGGVEDQSHITVKYGIDPSVEFADVSRALAGEHSFYVTCGSNGVFPSDNPDGAPLHITVASSADLNWLHILLTTSVANTETFPIYTPHITLAYIKPEAISKYAGGHTPLDGIQLYLSSVAFSDTDGNQTEIPLLEDWLPGAT